MSEGQNMKRQAKSKRGQAGIVSEKTNRDVKHWNKRLGNVQETDTITPNEAMETVGDIRRKSPASSSEEHSQRFAGSQPQFTITHSSKLLIVLDHGESQHSLGRKVTSHKFTNALTV
ncbi:hypothetical protein MHYP_G00028960 [Metynnis hypsauchen]